MDYEIIVNKENPVKEGFDPGNLLVVGKVYDFTLQEFSDKDILLEERTAKAFLDMIKEANEKYENMEVIPDSGYRTLAAQVRVLEYYTETLGVTEALKRVALPGTSEHHTGLAIDVCAVIDGKYIEDVTGEEEIIKYLHRNAHRFGFILRYPKGKEIITGYDYEPWHFRYVGKKLANYLYENNLTLDEYKAKEPTL